MIYSSKANSIESKIMAHYRLPKATEFYALQCIYFVETFMMNEVLNVLFE